MASPHVVFANPDYLTHLLDLGRHLRRDLCVKITLHLCNPPNHSSPAVRIAVAPVPLSAFHSLPETRAHREWREHFYASPDPSASLWVSFYHMIEERAQTRILGSRFAHRSTLLEKVVDLRAQFDTGHPVELFFSDFYMADELSCPPATTPALANSNDHSIGGNNPTHQLHNFAPAPLLDALAALHAEANRRGAAMHFALRGYEPGGTGSGNEAQVVDMDRLPHIARPKAEEFITERGPARVADDSEDVLRVAFLDDSPSARVRAAAALVTRVRAARARAACAATECDEEGGGGNGTGGGGGGPPSYPDNAFDWQVSATDVARAAAAGEDEMLGAVHYQLLANLAWQTTWRRVARTLAPLGVPGPDAVRYVRELFGTDVSAQLAAVAGGPGEVIQRGVCDASYSSIVVGGVIEGDGKSVGDTGGRVSLPISARLLRDVGRLGLGDNIVRPCAGREAEGNRVTMLNGTGQTVTVPEKAGTVVEGRIDDSVEIH